MYLIEVLTFTLQLRNEGLHKAPHGAQQGLVSAISEGQIGQGHTAIATHGDVVLFYLPLLNAVVHVQQFRYCLYSPC